MGDQGHPQHFICQNFHFFTAMGQFHTAAFATTTGMDLGFDHNDFCIKLIVGIQGIIYAESREAWRGINAVLPEDFLALIFMYFHVSFLITVPVFPSSASLIWGIDVTITFSPWYFKKCMAALILGSILPF